MRATSNRRVSAKRVKAILLVLVGACIGFLGSRAYIDHLEQEKENRVWMEHQEREHIRANDEDMLREMESRQCKDEDKPIEARGRDEVIDLYFNGKDAEVMKRICRAENRAEDATIINDKNADGTWDVGWCQINVDWNSKIVPGETRQEKVVALQNGDINIQAAHKIYLSWGRSFRAWSVYKNNSY